MTLAGLLISLGLLTAISYVVFLFNTLIRLLITYTWFTLLRIWRIEIRESLEASDIAEGEELIPEFKTIQICFIHSDSWLLRIWNSHCLTSRNLIQMNTITQGYHSQTKRVSSQKKHRPSIHKYPKGVKRPTAKFPLKKKKKSVSTDTLLIYIWKSRVFVALGLEEVNLMMDPISIAAAVADGEKVTKSVSFGKRLSER